MDVLPSFPDGLLDVFGQGIEKLIGILILLKQRGQITRILIHDSSPQSGLVNV